MTFPEFLLYGELSLIALAVVSLFVAITADHFASGE